MNRDDMSGMIVTRLFDSCLGDANDFLHSEVIESAGMHSLTYVVSIDKFPAGLAFLWIMHADNEAFTENNELVPANQMVNCSYGLVNLTAAGEGKIFLIGITSTKTWHRVSMQYANDTDDNNEIPIVAISRGSRQPSGQYDTPS